MVKFTPLCPIITVLSTQTNRRDSDVKENLACHEYSNFGPRSLNRHNPSLFMFSTVQGRNKYNPHQQGIEPRSSVAFSQGIVYEVGTKEPLLIMILLILSLLRWTSITCRLRNAISHESIKNTGPAIFDCKCLWFRSLTFCMAVSSQVDQKRMTRSHCLLWNNTVAG